MHAGSSRRRLSVTIIITILLTLLGILTGELGNLAASTPLPAPLKPYLQYAWVTFGVAIVLTILVSVWQAHRDEHEDPSSHNPALDIEKLRDNLLQSYFDQIRSLLMQGLRTSQQDAEIRRIAKAQTITIMKQLDPDRINHVFSFLRNTQLIDSDPYRDPTMNVISFVDANFNECNFRGVDLSYADFKHASFFSADLSGANLAHANLSRAWFSRTNLRGADLIAADLRGAELIEADLREAKLMAAVLDGANLWGATLTGAQGIWPSTLDNVRYDFYLPPPLPPPAL